MKAILCVSWSIGLAFASLTSQAADTLFGIDVTSGNLYRVSSSDASLTLVGNTGLQNVGNGAGALEFAPDGRLFALTVGTDPALYQIDPATAVASRIGALNIGWVYEGGLVFSPDGTAYGVNQLAAGNRPALFTVNLTTGQATILGSITGPANDINGLAWRSDGKLVALNNDPSLYFNTASLLTIDPVTLVSSNIGTLSPLTYGSINNVGGMAAQGDQGYFCTGLSGTFSLYSFDAFTGNSALVGQLAQSWQAPGLGGLAIMVPEPSASMLVALGVLVLWCLTLRPFRSKA